ncbi:AraC family transcriptional regulator [Algisphaera agarilytica]|uniref:AraC-like DNA-binding protein n=1 Tax=Algisphaera agarilytica TaxID=1385975 RepID=A0A7X0LKP0_9BACT|nr:AraC family transcriptional regulator [Algisphaera agarilytica]MBB6429153.1 AraC-like DNA-binding protein [Algisphaera agarilytica]
MSFLILAKELFHNEVLPVTATRIAERPLPQSDLHRHEFFEIIFVAEGTLHNRLADMEMSLEAGDILILKPFIQHQLETWSPKAAPRAYSCSFLPRAIDSSVSGLEEIVTSKSPNYYFFNAMLPLAEEDVSAVRLSVPQDSIELLEQLFIQLADLATHDDVASTAKSKCVFLNLLLGISDHSSTQKESVESSQRSIKVAATRHRAGLLKALAYIHEHLAEPITLEEVAEVANVSVSYFSLLIKQYTGMSFVNYLTSLRMDLAKSLMRSTSDSMLDICFKVGYSDYSNFSKRFKAVTGHSPRDYRRQA